MTEQTTGAVQSETDSTSYFTNAIAAGQTQLVLSNGRYQVTKSITIPAVMELTFQKGAVIAPDANITITMAGTIDAGAYPIFGGEGSIQTTNNRRVLPQWFGASASNNSYSVSTTAGSNQIVFSEVSDFQAGQSLIVAHAGAVMPYTTPTGLAISVSNPSGYKIQKPVTYIYHACAISVGGGISLPTTLSIKNDLLSWALPAYNNSGVQNRISISSSTSKADGYLIYGDSSNPEGSRGLIGYIRGGTTSWTDYGVGDGVGQSSEPWIPQSPPAGGPLNENLYTAVQSGAGTSTLVLQDNCSVTFSSTDLTAVFHDDTQAINKALSYIHSGGGGSVDFPAGVYNCYIQHQWPDNNSNMALNIYGNSRLSGSGDATLKGYYNWCLDNMIFAGLNPSSQNIEFHNLIFDGSNPAPLNAGSMEGNMFGIALPYTRDTSSDYYENIHIEDCEFYHWAGKAIGLYGNGYADNIFIRGNYIHNCSSNAIGVKASQVYVQDNVFQHNTANDAGGGAETIIVHNDSRGANSDIFVSGNVIKDWGSINFPGSFHHCEISNNIMTFNPAEPTYGGSVIGIGTGGSGAVTEEFVISNNVIDIAETSAGLTNSNAIVLDTGPIADNAVCRNIIVSNNSITIAGFNSAIQANNQNNSFNLYNIQFIGNLIAGTGMTVAPVHLRQVKDVTFSNNSITSDYNTAILCDSGAPAYRCIDMFFHNNFFSNQKLIAQDHSIITGNIGGAIAAGAEATIVGNIVSGEAGNSPITFGGSSLVTNNYLNITANAAAVAIYEVNTSSTQSDNSYIAGNYILGSTAARSIVNQGPNTVIYGNIGYNRTNTEGLAQPTEGKWNQGDKIWNTSPAPLGNIGWVCTHTGIACNTSWSSGSVYALGSQVTVGSTVYEATVAASGKSTVSPASNSGTQPGQDGYLWSPLGGLAIFKPFGAVGS